MKNSGGYYFTVDLTVLRKVLNAYGHNLFIFIAKYSKLVPVEFESTVAVDEDGNYVPKEDGTANYTQDARYDRNSSDYGNGYGSLRFPKYLS